MQDQPVRNGPFAPGSLNHGEIRSCRSMPRPMSISSIPARSPRKAITNAGRRSGRQYDAGSGAKVVVTGCYAATRPDEIRKIPGVDLVFDNRDKSIIPEQIMTSLTRFRLAPSITSNATATSVRRRTRGFLKIQDGCNNRCSYCIVPLARGSSRSVSPEDVIREFDRLVQMVAPKSCLPAFISAPTASIFPNRRDLTSLLINAY